MATTDVPAKIVLIRTVDGQRVKLRCPVCGDEAWAQAQPAPDVEEFQPVIVANSKNKGIVSMSITPLFCANCGFAAQFVTIENVSLEIVDK
jgi:predicted RNA-binding Zn-ribbon protein involved in translation (DUF1610 family)